jgi:hypothetical protein
MRENGGDKGVYIIDQALELGMCVLRGERGGGRRASLRADDHRG